MNDGCLGKFKKFFIELIAAALMIFGSMAGGAKAGISAGENESVAIPCLVIIIIIGIVILLIGINKMGKVLKKRRIENGGAI